MKLIFYLIFFVVYLKVYMLGNLMENMLLIKYFFIIGKFECVVWNFLGVRDMLSFLVIVFWWKI